MSYPLASLGEIASLQAGYGFPIELQGKRSGRYPFAKVGDISRCGRSENSILSSADHFVDTEDLVKLKAKPVPTGSVLFAKIGEAIKQNHRVVAGCEMLIDNNAMAAIPGERIDARFLYHFLKTLDFYSLAPATTVPALRKSELEKIKVPLPPLPEQRRIAAILDHADTLRAKRREALAELDQLTQSIFIEMFGDPVTNPKGWPKEAFGILSENQDSLRIPVKSTDRDGRQGQYPYYGASGIIDWVDEYIYDGERLLIAEDGANLLARSTPIAFIARGKFWVNNHAHVVAFNGRANLRFLEFLLEMLDLKPFISGSAQPKLNRANLDRTQVPVPSLELQNSFANRVGDVERIRTFSRLVQEELDSLFSSLQHRAFRGEL